MSGRGSGSRCWSTSTTSRSWTRWRTRRAARTNRDYLRGLYGVIKSCDAHVRFTFLTGISKFSKVNLFSQLNNLTDITLDRRYSAICGYTERDLDTVFAPELAGLDRERVREWYNGYRWRGAEKVYNPYDVLLLFDSREFKGHWFETGTPAFLVETLFDRGVSSVSLDRTVSTEELLSAFDVDRIGTEALLFQTGYLTITAEEELGGEALYRLGYPNREVRQSLNRVLLRHLVQDTTQQTANSIRLARLLEAHDCEGLRELFHAFFASIPYEWYTNNDIAKYEGYYASVFYSYFAALGYDIAVEESSSHGRLDMAVRAAGHVYLFEFKVAEMASAGLGPGAIAGAGVRRQVPRSGRADPPDRGRVQPRHAQRNGVRRGGCLTQTLPQRPEPATAQGFLLGIEEGLGQGVDAGAAVPADGGAPDVAGERRARHAASVQMELRLFREVQDGEAPVAGAQVAVRNDRRFPHEPARGHLGAGEPVAPAGPRLSLADALEGGLTHRQVAPGSSPRARRRTAPWRTRLRRRCRWRPRGHRPRRGRE